MPWAFCMDAWGALINRGDGMTNEQLVIRIQAGEDRAGELMAQLWEQNQGFLSMLARKYQCAAEYDDLMQEGFLGLCAAVEHFEPDKDASFLTYAKFWVCQYILRYIARNSPVGINLYQRARKYRRFVSQYEQRYGREPDAAEACYYLGISKRELQTAKEAAHRLDTASLDIYVGEDQETTLADLLPGDTDVESGVLDEVNRAELSAVLWPMVDALPGQIPTVLRARYQGRKTLKEIGEAEGCTLENIRQIERKGIYELRRSHRVRQLRPFLTEEQEAAAYRGNGAEQFNRTWTSSTERVALELV